MRYRVSFFCRFISVLSIWFGRWGCIMKTALGVSGSPVAILGETHLQTGGFRPGKKRSHQGFKIEYARQRETNKWKATMTELPEVDIVTTEGTEGFATARWEGQTSVQENHATVTVLLESAPRLVHGSTEAEVGGTVYEKAERMADLEFLARHPDADVKHSYRRKRQ
jgi:hypothetical protein